MLKQSNLFIKLSLALGLLFNSLFAHAVNPMSIKKETPEYIIDIKYPQGFKSTQIDQAVKQYIDNIQKSFMNELSEDADTPADAPGKTGLNVTYEIPYSSENALSVRFNVSIYHRGAAHPLNTVVVDSFVKGQQVTLNDLFLSGSNYLQPIAELSKKAITAKKISDKKWIAEGTKASAENYATWYFTEKGINFIFNTYQVAAYVYGEQTVVIPFSSISTLVKPEFAKAVWGN